MKSLIAFLALVSAAFTALAEDAPKDDARTVLEKWVAGAAAGKLDLAGPHADPNTSLSKEKGIKEFQEVVGMAPPKIVSVWVSEKDDIAAAMSDSFKTLKGDAGHLSFQLRRVAGRWLVKDLDFDGEEKAKDKLKAFAMKHADAKVQISEK